MTDREAFAEIMEINRKHKLGIEPDGWRCGPTKGHDQPDGRWYRPITVYSCNEEGNITEYNYADHLDDLDLQALTGVLGAWLEEGHDIIIRAWAGEYSVLAYDGGPGIVVRYKSLKTISDVIPETCSTRLQAQLAALRHVTGEEA